MFFFLRGILQQVLWPLLTSRALSGTVTSALVVFRGQATSRDSHKISRGKSQYLQCIDAGFIKRSQFVDGGLCYPVLARPNYVTPYIQFLFVTPHFRAPLPPHLISQ